MAVVGIMAGLCFFTSFSVSPAEARRRHHHSYHHAYHHHRHHHPHRHLARSGSRLRHIKPGAALPSQFAALIVDGNTGRELYGRDENALRHPASLTKVMTLYLLFEQLEKGRLHLDSRIPISAHAAAQPPTKIGLRPGRTIRVEDAIKAIVTQSANDIAVAVAEAIGGSESNFAEMMTRQAHALGMSRTHYANASGLPNDEQLTTAHDLAILGRDIQRRFPRYYHYFSTRGFDYHGVHYHNHNHLLGRVEGIDGIKTGYTRASGFNLLTSVKRDGHFIIGVVLGGRSWRSRDRIMDNLIEAYVDKGSTHRQTNMVAEMRDERRYDIRNKSNDRSESAPVESMALVRQPSKPVPLSDTRRIDAERAADIRPPATIARPRPAFVSATPKPVALADQTATIPPEPRDARHASFDGSTERPTTSTATPTSLRWVVGAQPARVRQTKVREAKVQEADVKVAEAESPRRKADATEITVVSGRPAVARRGWMIQIGATDDRAQASELLARAKAHGPQSLHRAKPFTEKIQKGSETFYRARFAGLAAGTAEAACKSLKRSGFACFATKN